MVIRYSITLTLILVLLLSLTPRAYSQSFELPLAKDQVDEIHRTLIGDMTNPEFEKACTTDVMKPPRWFLLRRKLSNPGTSSWKHIGARIFQFNDINPTTIVREDDLKQVLVYGDTWEATLSVLPKSFLGRQRMAPPVLVVATKIQDKVVLLGDLDYFPIASFDLSGQSQWTSRLHRVGGYSNQLNVEGFDNGEEITFFAADNRGEESSIESYDKASGKVVYWWSSKYRP